MKELKPGTRVNCPPIRGLGQRDRPSGRGTIRKQGWPRFQGGQASYIVDLDDGEVAVRVADEMEVL
jgi:hypothetical protein